MRFNLSTLKSYFIIFIITFLIFSIPASLIFAVPAKAAKIVSTGSAPQINFGKISRGTTTGSIASGCGATTGGVVVISGCTMGTLVVAAQNNGTNAGARRIRIFTPPSVSLMTTNDTSFTISGSNCTSGGSIPSGSIECLNPSTKNNNSVTYTINVNAALANISASQATNSYSKAFTLKVCGCNAGTNVNTACPANSSSAQCSSVTLGSTTLTGNVSDKIAIPLEITQGSSLRFGTIAAGPTAGTVTQAGVKTGGITVLNTTPRGAGQFNVTGETGGTYNYTYTVPSSVTLACDTGSTPSCSGKSMIADLTGVSANGSKIISGADSITVNGVLSIGANQKDGDYKGTYNVVVNY